VTRNSKDGWPEVAGPCPHVAGIAWSGAARRVQAPPDDQAETQ
jgi:hypothetical protein